MAKKSQKKSKKSYVTEDVLEASNEFAVKTESFIERNAKILGIVFGVLVVGALAWFAYLKYMVEPKNQEAFKEFYQAQQSFAQDSLQIALNGNAGGFIGYEGIIEEYGSTDAGNIANYMAGIAYYKEGDFKTAIEKLEKFSTSDPLMKAQKNGMIGNALVEAGNLEEGLKYYDKAIESSNNEALQTFYYMKAGKLALHLNQNENALNYFNALEEKYPEANGGEALKYIELLKYKK